MKAVIISDDDDVIGKINNVLTARNFDTIIYRWLLKALDNVEEIRPDVVVISTCDYPRHWKTFAQFVKSGIGGTEPQIILYTPAFFPASETEKASMLGIKGTFSSVDEAGLERFTSILNADKTTIATPQSGKNAEPSSVPAQKKQYGMIFTHPKTEAFVTGTVLSYDGERIEFAPDVPQLAERLAPGDHISEVSLKTGNSCSYSSADIVSTGKTILLKVGE
ncbi:MAG TPA: hypothetical protein DCL73_09160 [Treponema sp.]|nr:hypothetical protein [Treponema sp.]